MTEPLEPTLTVAEAASRRWDAIVIGAGPAGATAANLLARGGWATLLVDREAAPRSKVCGCCLGAGGVRALERLGLSDALRGAASLRSFRLLARGREASLTLRGGVAIGRDALDRSLAAMARDAGAALLWPAVARASPEGAVRLATPEGERTLRARAIIAADGLGGSSLRDAPGVEWKVAGTSRIGAGATLAAPPIAMAPGEILMLWDSAGYLGFVRLSDGTVNAAAAWDASAVGRGAGLASLAGAVVERAGGDPARVTAARWRGTPTLTRRRSAAQVGAVVVAGDAAGYVEPFTGEGMKWAVRSGEGAALRVAARLSGRARAHHSLRDVGRRLLPGPQTACAIVARALRSPALVGAVMRVAGRSTASNEPAGPLAHRAAP